MPTLRISSQEFPRLQKLSDSYKGHSQVTDARKKIGSMMVEACNQEPTLVPEVTGKLRGGYRYTIRTAVIWLINRVPYSTYVERGYPNARTRNVAKRSIQQAVPTIIREVKSSYPL